MSSQQSRAKPQSALQNFATSDLRNSAAALLATLGYASAKTLDLPAEPQAFAREVEHLLGGSKQLTRSTPACPLSRLTTLRITCKR